MLDKAKVIKHLAIILAWLLAAILMVEVASYAQDENLVITFDAEQNGNFQVFYPVERNSAFDEKNSERYGYNAGKNRSIAFKLPGSAPDLVRIDPFDGPASMLLRRIEITNFLAKATLQAGDLRTRLRASQSIDQVELQVGELLIHGNDIDPIMLLDLSNLKFERNTACYIAIVALLFGSGYLLLGAPISRPFRRKLAVFIVPLVLTAMVTYIFFPGYMTYDSLHALRGARNGVADSIWPPIVSYVWRMEDALYSHPSGMLFSQVLLLLVSTSIIVFHYTGRVRFVILSLGSVLLIPVVLGTVAAIWKDVLMASFFTAAFAAMLQIEKTRTPGGNIAYFCLAIALLFFGTAARHNAITAAIPLAFYLGWLTVRAFDFRHRIAAASTIGLIGIACIFGIKVQLDKYSIPGFKPIAGVASLVPITQRMDIVAASICANENLFKNVAPALTIDYMKAEFDARHVNLSANALNKIPPNADIRGIWLNTLKEHPICFWSNKAQLVTFLVGANHGEQFLVVSPQVDFNEYGYYLPRSPLRTSIEDYIRSASDLAFFRPWFLYALTAIALLCLAYFERRIDAGYLVLWLSAIFYAAGLFMFGNAADARLLFYTNFLHAVILAILCSRLFLKRRLTESAR